MLIPLEEEEYDYMADAYDGGLRATLLMSFKKN